MKLNICWLLLCLMSGSALADWASGGGAVLKDAENPWFLQNTRDVSVCVIWDQDNFHPVDRDAEGLVKRIKDSLEYWRKEFSRSFVVGNVVTVGAQNFEISEIALVGQGSNSPSRACLASDLRIQFGWLSSEQIEFFNAKMGGVQRYISAIVRTDYDQVKMRGKGFIYLKPDTGPLSAPAAGMTTKPWSLGQGYLIDYALRHELGHMFGVPHKGIESVMAVDFLERAFHDNWSQIYANDLNAEGFFSWNMSNYSSIRDYCGQKSRKGWTNFLAIPADHDCINIQFLDGKIIFSTGVKQSGQIQWSRRGEMIIDPGQRTFMWDEAVRIYLPEQQTVVNRVPPGAGVAPWILGPMIKREELSGTFRSTDGTLQRKVFISLDPVGVGYAASRFSVEMDGKWHWNLDWEY